jgi:hypothetical protein
MENQPAWAAETGSPEHTSVNSNMLTEVGERRPGNIVGDTMFSVPLSHDWKGRKEHIYVEESTNRPQMRRECLPSQGAIWITGLRDDLLVAALQKPPYFRGLVWGGPRINDLGSICRRYPQASKQVANFVHSGQMNWRRRRLD